MLLQIGATGPLAYLVLRTRLLNATPLSAFVVGLIIEGVMGLVGMMKLSHGFPSDGATVVVELLWFPFAIGIAAVEASPAGVHQQGLAGRRHNQGGLSALHVHEEDVQGLRRVGDAGGRKRQQKEERVPHRL